MVKVTPQYDYIDVTKLEPGQMGIISHIVNGPTTWMLGHLLIRSMCGRLINLNHPNFDYWDFHTTGRLHVRLLGKGEKVTLEQL